jgi:hypothetical protein
MGRRTKEATFFCDWENCGQSFTAKHNLKSTWSFSDPGDFGLTSWNGRSYEVARRFSAVPMHKMQCRLYHKQCLEASLPDLQTSTEDVELGRENEGTGILTAGHNVVKAIGTGAMFSDKKLTYLNDATLNPRQRFHEVIQPVAEIDNLFYQKLDSARSVRIDGVLIAVGNDE